MSDRQVLKFQTREEIAGDKVALRRAQLQLAEEMEAAREAKEEKRKLEEEERNKKFNSRAHIYDL